MISRIDFDMFKWFSRVVVLVTAVFLLAIWILAYWQDLSFGKLVLVKTQSPSFMLQEDQTEEVMQGNATSHGNCNNEIFRQYLQRHGYFPGLGKWNGSQFHPNICEFKPTTLSADYLLQCMRKSELTSVATLGDSQGMRYFNALLEHFRSVASGCTRIKVERMAHNVNAPGKDYFAQGNKTLENAFAVKRRGCVTCISQEWHCHFARGGSNMSLRLEHISMNHLWDQSLTIKDTSALKSEYTFASFQEFVFRYYFKKSRPGLILLFAPINHEKVIRKFEVSKSLDKIVRILEETEPTTEIFVLGGTAEFEHKKYKRGLHRQYARFDGMLATEKIDLLNHLMCDVLKKLYLSSRRQIHGFMDMVAISRSLVSWNKDGIHFIPVWYESVMSYILQLFCNDTL